MPLTQGSLSGKVIAITGASRGIGRGMAVACAGEGAHVVAIARSETDLKKTCEMVEEAGGAATLILCDVTREDSVEAMAEEVKKRVGNVDVLVNNAGVASERSFLELSIREFRDTFDVNVVGPFLVSRAIGRSMIERTSGKIINIGSVQGLIGIPNLVHYCASKGAVVQLTRGLAAEWAKFGITVNCLCPGYFPTDINAEMLADEDLRSKIVRRIPLRRLGDLREITSWVVFMAGDGSDYMTGQVVVVDGGETAR